MPKVVIVVSSNRLSRKDFGYLLDEPYVKRQLPTHAPINTLSIVVSEPTRDVLSNLRVGYLELGLLLTGGADPNATCAIVQEEVLKNVPRPFQAPSDVLEKTFVVSPNGKVTVLKDLSCKSESA